MLNNKPLLGLAAMSIFATGSAFALPPGHEDDKTGDVVFSASVESQCGIEATEDKADLAFGENYNDSHATVKLVSNKDGVKVRAEEVKIESFDGQIQKSDVYTRFPPDSRLIELCGTRRLKEDIALLNLSVKRVDFYFFCSNFNSVLIAYQFHGCMRVIVIFSKG